MEYNAVGKSVRILNSGDWVEGFIDEYHPSRGYHIQYFDGDSAWVKRLDKGIQILSEEQEEPEQQQNVDEDDNLEDDLDEINFFQQQQGQHQQPQAQQRSVHEEDEDELVVIPNKVESRKNSKSKVPDLDLPPTHPKGNTAAAGPNSNRTNSKPASVAGSRQPSRPASQPNSRPASAKSQRSTTAEIMQADEKPSSRRESFKQTASAVEEPLPLEDELLMQDDLDDAIMYKTVDGEETDDAANSRVIVNAVDMSTPTKRSPRYNFTDDSLLNEFKESPRREFSHHDEVEELGVEDEEEFVPDHLLHDLDYYQERSREIIVAQSVLLQPSSILLVGSILSANISVDPAAPSDQRRQSKDFEAKGSGPLPSEMFFRVLFIEGGNQPIMFRCKTPIFTSNNAISRDMHPIWRENVFRCDMLMPVPAPPATSSASTATKKKPSTAAAGKRPGLTTIAEGKSEASSKRADQNDEEGDEGEDQQENHTAPFPVSGDIVISVYRVRLNGGNDLMGQIVIDLKKMAKNGTYEYFNEICEGRCYSGKYPLVAAQGNGATVGEIELHLAIAWKIPPVDPSNRRSRSNLSTSQEIRPKSAVSVATGKRTAATGTQNPKTVTIAGPKKVVPEQRKFISAQAKRQRDQQKKIDMENMKLQSRIQNLSGHTSGIAYTKGDKTAQTIASVSGKSKPAPLVNNFIGGGGGSVNGGAAGPEGAANEKKVYEKYLQLLNRMKKSVADEESEILSTKAKLNNCNIQIKKFQSSIEKIKSFGPGGGSVVSGTSRMSRATSARGRESKDIAPAKENTSQRGALDSKSSRQSKQHDDGEGNEYEREAFERHDQPETPTDPEHASIKEEYDMLQKIRKSLVDRIIKAKEVYQTFFFHENLQQSQQEKILHRIHSIQALGGGDEPLAQPFDENNSQFEKLVHSPRANGKGNGAGTGGWEENDLEVFHQLVALLQERSFFEEQVQENIELLSLQSNYEEYNQTFLFLQERLLSLGKEVQQLQADKERIVQQSSQLTATTTPATRGAQRSGRGVSRAGGSEAATLAAMAEAEEEEVQEKRNLIFFLQSLHASYEKEQQMNQILAQIKENELALMYMQMKQKEREENKRIDGNLSAISSIPNISQNRSQGSLAISSQANSRTTIDVNK